MEEEEILLLSDDELAASFVGDAYSMYMKEVFSYRLLSMEENKELAGAIRRELMAIYEITPREFMSGKEINHVYKIFNTVDELLRGKGISVQIKKKD